MAHLKELALVQLSGRTLHFLREGETLQLIPLNWCLVILIRYWFGGLALSISLLVSPSALLLSFNTNKYISEVHYSMLYCCCFFNIWTTSELCRCHAWTALHNVANNLFLTMRDSDQSSSFSTSVQCQTHTVDHNVNRVIKIGGPSVVNPTVGPVLFVLYMLSSVIERHMNFSLRCLRVS